MKKTVRGKNVATGSAVEIAFDETILGITPVSSENELYLAPGFIDLQVNGFAGVDFMTADAEGWARAGEGLLECGVTAVQPTFVSAPESGGVGSTTRTRSWASRPARPSEAASDCTDGGSVSSGGA